MVTLQLDDKVFKPNVAVVLVDFHVRHGFTSSDDDGYLELLARAAQRRVPLSTAARSPRRRDDDRGRCLEHPVRG